MDKVLQICSNLQEFIQERVFGKQSSLNFSSLRGFVEFLVDFLAFV